MSSSGLLRLSSAGVLLLTVASLAASREPPGAVNSTQPLLQPHASSAPDGSLAVSVRVANASNHLALKLLRALPQNGNICFSPHSVASSLSALYQGADGLTAYELGSALAYGDNRLLNRTELAHGYGQLRYLVSQSAGSKALIDWSAVLVQEGFNVLTNYTKILREQYGTEVRKAQLGEASTLRAINQEVSSRTAGRIPEVLSEPLPAQTRMVLLNVIYFKGKWLTQFDPSKTYRGLFYGADGHPVETRLMYSRMRAPLARLGGTQVLVLPYEGGGLRMMILLPQRRGGLSELQQRLGAELLQRMDGALKASAVDVVLPRFRLQSDLQLRSTAAQLGMPSAFLQNIADLSRITGRSELYATELLHRAFLEVNEEGTEAAGTTVLGTGLRRRPNVAQFVADRPFLILIRDARTGLVLFLGRVNKI